MRVSEAEAIFHVRPRNYSRATIHAIYRQAARLVHPDRGGSREAWDQLQTAYLKLLAEADRPKTCLRCQGQKVLSMMVRGCLTVIKCPSCDGTGTNTSEDPIHGT